MPLALCLNSNTYHGFTLQDAIDGASASGIGLIELAAVRGYTEHVLPGLPEAALQSIADTLADRGLRPVALGGHSNLLDPSGRGALVRNLDLAADLGARYVVTGTGETHGDEAAIDDEEEFEEGLRQLAREARARDLRIAIETHGANFATGRQVSALVGRVGHPALGVCYDTGNTVFYGDVLPYEDLQATIPELIGVHLKDKRGGPGVWDFPAIGDGELDIARILSLLSGVPSDRLVPLSIEIEFTTSGPADLAEVHAAVARSVEFVRGVAGSELVA